MKKLLAAIASSVLVVLPVLDAAAQFTFDNEDGRRTIFVYGEALVYATPDQVTISLGVEKRDEDLAKAKGEADAALAATLAAIRGAGIADNDIQADAVSIRPAYYSGEFRHYIVSTKLLVTTSDASAVEPLIEAVLGAGATHIYGVDHQTTELRKYRDTARDMAVKAAKEKADRLAAALGEKVGGAVRITEQSDSNSLLYYSDNARMDMRDGNSSDDAQKTLLGKISVRARVSVTFGLK